jgi:hypothetical protein
MTTESPKETTAKVMGDASQLVSQYARMNAELLQAAVKSAAPLMTAWSNWYQSLLPVQMKVAGKPGAAHSGACVADKSCCEIPETGCPPRCACTVRWDACTGERRVAAIRIRNTSKDSVTYTLSAKPFESCGKTSTVSPLFTPASITAAAGQTVQAEIGVVVTDAFQAGTTWHAEVLVSGKYERCVKVELHIECDECCSFDLGDIPYRTKADEWYRHFQCSSPCFAPVAPPPPNPNPVGTTTVTANPVGVVDQPQTQTGS